MRRFSPIVGIIRPEFQCKSLSQLLKLLLHHEGEKIKFRLLIKVFVVSKRIVNAHAGGLGEQWEWIYLARCVHRPIL